MRFRTRRQVRELLTGAGAALTVLVGLAWSLMITTGNAHQDWWPRVPAMGFRTAIALTAWPLIAGLAAGCFIALLRELAR